MDWQSYIQWRDEWLKKFAMHQADEPQLLFVLLRRTHYFNDDVPNLDEKLVFRLTSAVPDDEGLVAFVERDSDLGRELESAFEWRKVYSPVVELQWVKEGGHAKYVRLTRMGRPSWRRME